MLRILLGVHYLQSSVLKNDILASRRMRVSTRPRVTILVKPVFFSRGSMSYDYRIAYGADIHAQYSTET